MEKRRKGYVEQKTLSGNGVVTKPLQTAGLQQLATQQIATNAPEAVALIKKLVAANVHNILESTTLHYNAANGTFSTPLGLVTQDALDEARRVLTDVGGYVAAGAYHDARLLRAANRFLTLIPQNIGRSRRDVRDLFPDKALQEKYDLLDNLETSLNMALTDPTQPDNPVSVFEASINLIESRSEFRRLNAKYKSTLNSRHASASLVLKRA